MEFKTSGKEREQIKNGSRILAGPANLAPIINKAIEITKYENVKIAPEVLGCCFW